MSPARSEPQPGPWCRLSEDGRSFDCKRDCGSRCDGVSGLNGTLLLEALWARNETRALQRLLASEYPAREVRVTRTLTDPPFLMAIGEGSRSEVSKLVAQSGVHEALHARYWKTLVGECCARGGRVLDVGANLGWYSLFSARLGCRVHSWEPVPAFADFLELSASLNGFASRIRRCSC